MGTVASALEGAKKALANANKFQSSAGGPLHEHANASYTAVREARKSPEAKAPTLSDELKAKADNVNQYVNAPK